MTQPKIVRETLVSAAHEYVDMGISVIPVRENKKPALDTWRDYQRRCPTHEEIDEWGDLFEGIAIVTGQVSGILIVDADTADAERFCILNGLSSPISYNTNKGRHYLFAHPGGSKRFTNGTLHGVHVNLDFRGDGGYAICPPTEIDGKHRRWSMRLDRDDLPMWGGRPSLSLVSGDFDVVDLSFIPPLTGDVWEEMEWRISRGEYVREGERNNTLTRFLGHKVREGLTGDELREAVDQFISRFYADPMDEDEIERTIRSVQATDIRNYPEDYDDNGKRKRTPVGYLLYVNEGEVDRQLATARHQQMHVWPFVPHGGSTTQLYSWTGTGKSLFTMLLFHHAARGVPFGPFDVDRPVKTLVFDFENGRRTLLSRLSFMNRSFGDPQNNLIYWSPSFNDAEPIHSLRSDEGKERFLGILDYVKPDVAVVDTTLSAFPGLEVKESEAWAFHNLLIRRLRNAGVGVMMLHHGTKPDEKGYTRENGSGTQLNDIETQIKLTDLFRDEQQARAKGGVCDPDTCNSLIYMLSLKYPTARATKATRITFGKVRDHSPLHNTVDMVLGRQPDGRLVYMTTPEVSKRMLSKRLWSDGKTISEISATLDVEPFYVEDWVTN